MTKATIDHVAELAGVSIKTVSRVVNNEPNVRQSTQDKVREAIKRLNYRPSPSARSLASNRSFLVALLYDNPSAHYITDVQEGILGECRKRNYDLLIHPCNYLDENLRSEIENLVGKSRLDGLILTPPLSDMKSVTDVLGELKMPYVRIAPSEHHELSACVYCDDHHASYQMAEHLIGLGHRRIGFIAGHPDHSSSLAREAGFMQALNEHGIKLPKKRIHQGYFDCESGRAAAEKMLGDSHPPTAIFACNDNMAAGVIQVAHGLNIDVPGELSVTGFDDAPICELTWPELTTIRQPIEELAQSATALLLDELAKKPKVHAEEALHCNLVIRQSTAPAPK